MIGHALVDGRNGCGFCGGRELEVLRLDFWEEGKWGNRIRLYRCGPCLSSPVTASDVNAASSMKGWK